jgi:hypothetical protein
MGPTLSDTTSPSVGTTIPDWQSAYKILPVDDNKKSWLADKWISQGFH